MHTTKPAEKADHESGATQSEIEIRALIAGEDATAFRTLNEEWITRYFTLEERDIETLRDPETAILRKGGHIFMVHLNAKPIGCVALIPIGAGVFELSKMAVSPDCRGRGIGRRLIEYTIRQARMLGASSVFLGSSTKLPSAIHLYESVGFRHVHPDSLPPVPYTRANIFMQLSLDSEK